MRRINIVLGGKKHKCDCGSYSFHPTNKVSASHECNVCAKTFLLTKAEYTRRRQ